MTFYERLKEITENYLTAGMASAQPQNANVGSAPKSPLKANSNIKNNTGNINKTPQTTSANANQNDLLTSLILRASESEDGFDGLDEFDEYITSLGVDRNRLSGSFSELSRRLGKI